MSLRLPMAHSYNNDMHACDCHMIKYNIANTLHAWQQDKSILLHVNSRIEWPVFFKIKLCHWKMHTRLSVHQHIGKTSCLVSKHFL